MEVLRKYLPKIPTSVVLIAVLYLTLWTQNEEVDQQVQPLGTPKTDETSPKTPPSEDADKSGCGCGS